MAASFAKAGVKGLVLVARNPEALAEVVKETQAVNALVNVVGIAADLLDAASISTLWEKVKAEFGHADILVNNAGVFEANVPIVDADPDEWWANLVRWLSPAPLSPSVPSQASLLTRP